MRNGHLSMVFIIRLLFVIINDTLKCDKNPDLLLSRQSPVNKKKQPNKLSSLLGLLVLLYYSLVFR